MTLAACGSGSGGAAETGTPLPDLAVRPLGETSDAALGQLTGEPLVLNLWAPWCQPCKAEMPDFDTVAQQRDDVRIVGLATGTREEAAISFADDIGVTYELMYDIDDRALVELGIEGLPATLFVAADGTIVETHSGVLTAAELSGKIDTLLAAAQPAD